MLNERFSKTTSLLLVATFALAFAGTVSAADPLPIGTDGLPEFLEGDTLATMTFFLFFIGYISMGAAFVFFMSLSQAIILMVEAQRMEQYAYPASETELLGCLVP